MAKLTEYADLVPRIPDPSMVTLERARTGLSKPLNIQVVESVNIGGTSPVGARLKNPYVAKFQREGYNIYSPRTDAETQNVVAEINKARKAEGKNPISVEQFNWNNNKFLDAVGSQLAVTREQQKRSDPYKYFVGKWKNSYDGKKLRNATEGSDSIFDLISNPKQYLKDKGTAYTELLKDGAPGDRRDFVMMGEVIGGFASLISRRGRPGMAKKSKSVYEEIMSSQTGDVAKTVGGASIGGGTASLVYDLTNSLIRRTKGISNPEDAPNPALQALAEMRNTAIFTLGAAGLGPVASVARPYIGKFLFGLEGPAHTMSNIADLYKAPIGIATAALASGRGPLAGAASGFRSTLGRIPFSGGKAMLGKTTLASANLTKGMQDKIVNFGEDLPLDEIIKYQKDSFRDLPRQVRLKLTADAKKQGYKSYFDLLEAEMRVNELAPIQHMTDVGMLMTKKAQERYAKFSYINDLLYKDFEKKAKSISKPFISTENTRMIAQNLRDEIRDMTVRLRSGNEAIPMLNEIDEFIMNKLGELPDYISPMQLRGLQRDINTLYGNIVAPLKKDAGGAALLGSARKALTADLNNFAGWSKELADEEMLIAEAAKKSLLRANETFSKMAPLYKSQIAKTFQLVDQNMFSAGPELPGFLYSDEIGQMIFRNGITPQRVDGLYELVGPTAFKSGVQSWINKAFKNSMDKSAVVTREVVDTFGNRKNVAVTEHIFNGSKFMKNLNLDDPGFKRMIDLSGESGEAFLNNVEQLSVVQDLLAKSGLGGTTSQMIARRLSLGGLRSAINTFSITGGGALAATGNAPSMTVFGTLMAGMLLRRTASFLSTPEALKSYTRVVAPDASVGVRRAAFVNFLNEYFKRDENKSDIPKQYQNVRGVMNDVNGFMDWLYGSGYEAVMSSLTDGAHRKYMNERYGNNMDLSYNEVIRLQQDQQEYNDYMEGNLNIDTASVGETMETPNIETGGESIFNEDEAVATATGPGLNTDPDFQPSAPLNANQRVALAGGNLDEAIALGQRRV